MPFTYAHVFPYSPRPNTSAAKFSDQIDYATKMARAKELRQLFTAKNFQFRSQLLAENIALNVVADSNDLTIDQVQKGICEYYVQCNFKALNNNSHRIHKARPTKLTSKGLFVEIYD